MRMTVQVSTEESGLTGWFKSSFSSNANACVEVTFAPEGSVSVRDSKQGERGPVVTLPERYWGRVLIDALEGTNENGVLDIEHRADGGARLRADAVTLDYTPAEWAAFRAGVRTGEFHTGAPLAV